MSHHLSIACFSFVAGITPILSLAITRARTPWRSPLASTATLLLIVLARPPQHNSEQREALADSISHKLHPMVEQYAQLFKTGIRTPVLKRPSDIGLDYEDVFFPSLDGIPLEAWFIPADSDKLLIVNHPMTCNRYGFPGHLPPWNTMFGGFEVKTSCRS